jgi:hypothetical protein
MWTKVSLKDAKMRATPKTSSPCGLSVCALLGLRDGNAHLADLGAQLDVLRRTALDLLLGRHDDCELVLDFGEFVVVVELEPRELSVHHFRLCGINVAPPRHASGSRIA